jgi:hypothetical protein
MSALARYRWPLAAFTLAFVALALVSGGRIKHRSTDPHFVVQAAAWLHGHVDIPSWPAGADDPAKVEEVTLDDGRVVQGRRIVSHATFRVAGSGEEISLAHVTGTRREIFYNSFPPFPSVLLLPQAAISGERANDVLLTVLLAAAVPAVFLLLGARLREAGLSTRTPADDAWYAALLTFGTVFFFSAVQGRVWFTAHVVGVLVCALYALFSIEARRPILAGLMLGFAFITRAPMLFMFPLFLSEAWRMRGDGVDAWKRAARQVVLFGAPVVVIGLAAAWYNHVRFHEWTEFGHSYLAVRQQAQIERYGLFNLHYLGRNLAVAFTLLPDVTARAPYWTISGHGLAMWFTTPALLYVLWPRDKGPLHRALWLTVAFVAIPSLLYQNSGWVQFGYRFSLDYMLFLVLLLVVGGRPLTHLARGLIVVGILVNLIGAITFVRSPQHYRMDNATYNTVVAQ